MQEKPNLDLLRAIAVILVVFDHTMLIQGIHVVGSWNPGWVGVFGVYLFFVHTCLVLMWSLDRKPHTLDFYIRRAFRIYPLAMVAVACVVLAHVHHWSNIQLAATPYHFDVRNFFENLLLVQNIGRGGNYMIGVLWSLPLEVNMYVILPVLYFFVRKNFSVWPLLILWTLACALARPALSEGNNFATVIPCFLPGVMAYIVFGRVKPRLPAWTFPVFLAALLAFFMHFSRVAASWPTCLALGLGLPFFNQIRYLPLKRISHELAKYSYGIYLGHPFALSIAFVTFRDHSLWLKLPVEFGLIAIFSFAGYHLVERPMIRRGARVAAKAELRYEQHQHV